MDCSFFEIAGFCIDPFWAAIATVVFVLGIAFFIFSLSNIEDQNSENETSKTVLSEVIKEYYLLQRQVKITILWKDEGREQLTINTYVNSPVTVSFEEQDEDTLPDEVELQPNSQVKFKVYVPSYFNVTATLDDGVKETIEIERP